MAFLRLRCCQNGGYLLQGRSFTRQTEINKYVFTDHNPHQKVTPRCRLSIAAKLVDHGTSTSSDVFSLDYLIRSGYGTCDDWTEISNVRSKKRTVKKEDNSEKLDQWMRASVVRIVNNISEAPFLLHIYSDDETKESCSNTSISLVIEKAVAQNWPAIKERWKAGNLIPDGVILVEELRSNEVFSQKEAMQNDTDSTTKTWGVLIQAKGLNSTACYILRTCQVKTFCGICTHFYLIRVNCFVENAENQLKKMWLQR